MHGVRLVLEKVGGPCLIQCISQGGQAHLAFAFAARGGHAAGGLIFNRYVIDGILYAVATSL